MSEKKTLTPIAAALGTTFAVSLIASPLANATDNPFELTELKTGYMVVQADEAADDAAADEMMDDDADEMMDDEAADDEEGGEEGSCGEGSCGESSDDT